MTTDTPRRRDYLILGLLILLAAALRVPGLWQFDLWQDEMYSIHEARELYASPIGPGGMELRQLYFLMLHPLAEAFPRSAVLLRLPSLLFGLLGIAATWRLTWQLAGRWAAMTATVLLVIFPLHINESQSIRYWSLVFLLGALFIGALLRAMELEDARAYTWALAWLLLASLTHPTFMVLAGSMVLGAHLVRGDGTFGFRWPSAMAWRRLWLPYLGTMAAVLGVLALLFPMERLVGESAGSALRLFPAVVVALTPAVALAVAVGLACLWRAHTVTPRRAAAMIAAGMGVAGLVLIVGRLANQVPVSILYLFGAFPLAFAALGALVPGLAGSDAARQRRAALAISLVLGASLLPSTISHLRDGTRFDYRPALAQVVREDPAGTVVIWPLIAATWYAPDLHAVEMRATTTTATLDSLAATTPRFWVVTSERRYGTVLDADGSRTAWLRRHCRAANRQEKLRFDWDVYAVTLFQCEGARS